MGANPLVLDDADHPATTTATRLDLLISGVTWYDEALSQGLEASYLCGHSVGLWSAVVCAGALGLRTAIRLVQVRGEAMKASSRDGDGMLAVIGLSERMLGDIVESDEAKQPSGLVCGCEVDVDRVSVAFEESV